MQQNGRHAPGSSRRIGGGAPAAADWAVHRWTPQGWVLKIAGAAFVWPLFLSLMRGSFRDAVASAAAAVSLFVGGRLIARGCSEEAANAGRTLALSPAPWKLLGTAGAAFGAFAVSYGPAHDGVLMALFFAALTAVACILAYGLDPRVDRAAIEAAAARAGIKAKDVLATLEDAHRKVRGIEEAAARLHSREIKARLDRIARQARTILGQLEENPKDLSRARRFLVTYLDGTRDVVAKYAQQQQDLADTPLGENFRRVLTTVEQVFAEQEEVLRRDDKLDLEVQIEVLETQLKREGLH